MFKKIAMCRPAVMALTGCGASPTLRNVALPAATAPTLYGDGIHNDSPAIQYRIDQAYKTHAPLVGLPAGKFRLKEAIHFYGQNVRLQGAGDSTLLLIDNNFDSGAGHTGHAIDVSPAVGPVIYPIAVNGATLTFTSSPGLKIGSWVFVNNGRGSSRLTEVARGGSPTMAFFELAPCEICQVVATVSPAVGPSTVTLSRSIDFNNINIGTDEAHLHLRPITVPAVNLAISDLSIDYLNGLADTGLTAYWCSGLVIERVSVPHFTKPSQSSGGMWINSCVRSTVRDCNIIGNISVNACRRTVFIGNHAGSATMEESVSNCVFFDNDVGLILSNDLTCERNVIAGNRLPAGPLNLGAIALQESYMDVLFGNVVTPATNPDCPGQAQIWVAGDPCAVVIDNTARLGLWSATNWQPFDKTIAAGNK